MADVFISYSSKNRDRAGTLATALIDRGLSVWWDREIVTGQSFDQAIERELEAARCVVVLWSQDSVDSEWVRNEAASAGERGVLLPVNIDGTRPPLEFRRKQTADLTNWSGDPAHPGFQALCRGINSIIGGGATSRAQPIAMEKSPKQTRRLAFGAVAFVFAVVMVVAGAYFTSNRMRDSSTLGLVSLADAVVGTYVGEVIADSKGGSRTNIVVVVNRLDVNTVRVTSPYSRMGTVDVELTQADKKIISVAGTTPFIVDLAVTPPTLAVNPRGELAYHGTLKR